MSLLTEDEAKTKWCPLVRMWDGNNRHDSTGPEHWTNDKRLRCIGSACMAWRWGMKLNPDWKPRHGMMSYSEVHPDEMAQTHIADNKHGYCGAFGHTDARTTPAQRDE